MQTPHSRQKARIFPLIALLGMLLPLGCDRARGAAPAAKVRRVMIISLDGARPDVLLRGDAPNVRELCGRGCFTFWAQTIDYPMTLPAHTSMVTGVTPDRHGVWTDSDWTGDDRPYPSVPTLFQLAKAKGLTTALAAGKSKFQSLNVAGSLDWTYIPEVYAQDLQVAQQAVDLIRQHQPEVMLVHLPGLDAAGHRYGWGSDQQVQAVREADLAVGLVLGSLRQCDLLDSTVVIVTADHGGIGWSHWAKDNRTIHIPWIIAGPGIRRNVDLAQYQALTINTCDTFATACNVLGISPPGEIDGKVVTQAMEYEAGTAPEGWGDQWDDAAAPDDDMPGDDEPMQQGQADEPM